MHEAATHAVLVANTLLVAVESRSSYCKDSLVLSPTIQRAKNDHLPTCKRPGDFAEEVMPSVCRLHGTQRRHIASRNTSTILAVLHRVLASNRGFLVGVFLR